MVSTRPAPATKSSNARCSESAFSALHDPTSRAYYDKKRAEKKKHNAALICLARRRCDVLYAMLKNRELYRAPLPSAA